MTSVSLLKVAHKRGGNWLNESGTGAGTISAGSVTSSSLSTWSPFTLGVASNVTLPITWLYFTGQAMDNGNVLSWQTVSETNNNGFEIQSSTDVVRFQTIGFVAGKGTTTERQAYQFEDLSPLDQLGDIAYYRLKQVDFDARFEYSRIIAIVRKEQKQVSVFPNPSNGIFTITGIENLNDETFTLGFPWKFLFTNRTFKKSTQE